MKSRWFELITLIGSSIIIILYNNETQHFAHNLGAPALLGQTWAKLPREPVIWYGQNPFICCCQSNMADVWECIFMSGIRKVCVYYAPYRISDFLWQPEKTMAYLTSTRDVSLFYFA